MRQSPLATQPFATLRSALRTPSRAWLRPLALGAALLGVLALVLINLPAYPAPWFDEGQYLHVPKAVLQHGVYADWSSEGPRYFGPTTAAGPTVLLPITLVDWVFGPGLAQARAVMVLYLLAMLALVYLLAAGLYDRKTALLAVALLLSSRGAATLVYGRQVQGEIPALLFVLGGLYWWGQSLARQCGRRALAAGVCFGTAMITKNQAAIVLAPALALIALLDWRLYRNRSWLRRSLPVVVAVGLYGVWLVILFAWLGPGNLSENIAATRKATSGALIVLTPDAAGRALRFLLSPTLYGGLLVPALAARLWQLRTRRDSQAQSEGALLAIALVWLAWFVCSLGWPRYAFIGVALGALPLARVIVQVFERILQARRPWLTAGMALAVAALILVPLAQTTRELLSPDRSVFAFAALLNQSLPTDTLIETWEPELGGITDHRYHYPPQALLDVAVRHQWGGGPPAQYDLDQTTPPYVVVGPFGSWTGVYPAAQLERDYRPLFREGPYVLYRRQP